ncbi:MAG: universal stress protein [Terracidiphilus sp.]|nr:universal stress protein [Terracidiphilus sp.]
MQELLPARWSDPAVILVATDLTDLDRLMPFALNQAALSLSHLILLHVIPTASAISLDAIGDPVYEPTGVIRQAEIFLHPWCEAAARRNVLCDVVVREGDAASQIEGAARQFRADRILIGTRNSGKGNLVLLGSVAEQVLRSVNLPVITVGPEAHLQVDSGEQPPVILHATTLRETSRPSAALACQLAARHGARLILLHVLPPIDAMEQFGELSTLDAAARNELGRLARETAAGSQVEIVPRIVHGNPLIEILAVAAQCRARCIVLGAASRRTFDKVTRDRTVFQVLAHARCPVLTLREPQAAHESEREPAAAAERG